MNLGSFLDSNYFSWLVTFVSGGAVTFVATRLMSRRAVFSYLVSHSHIGVSADDKLMGSVRVTWQGQELTSLWLTSIELKNTSMKDYSDFVVKIYSAENTNILTEQTEISGSIDSLSLTEEYKKLCTPLASQNPTEEQQDLRFHQRHYLVPVLNRNQSIKFNYLTNVIHGGAQILQSPGVWVDIQHRDIRVKQKFTPTSAQQIFSIPIPSAVFAGLPIAVGLLAICIVAIEEVWVLSGVVFAIGLLVAIPGAIAIRLYQWAKALLTG